jgi:hypothetical protein
MAPRATMGDSIDFSASQFVFEGCARIVDVADPMP